MLAKYSVSKSLRLLTIDEAVMFSLYCNEIDTLKFFSEYQIVCYVSFDKIENKPCFKKYYFSIKLMKCLMTFLSLKK